MGHVVCFRRFTGYADIYDETHQMKHMMHKHMGHSDTQCDLLVQQESFICVSASGLDRQSHGIRLPYIETTSNLYDYGHAPTPYMWVLFKYIKIIYCQPSAL